MRLARLFRLPRAQSRLITWGDLTLAALIGFVAAPIVLALLGAGLTAVLPQTRVSEAVSTAASILAVSTPIALLGSIPGVLLARLMVRIGWIGPLSIMAAGGCLAAVAGLGDVSVLSLLAAFGALYAGFSWLALRILRHDVFGSGDLSAKKDKIFRSD